MRSPYETSFSVKEKKSYQDRTLSAIQTMKTPMFPKPLINIIIISKKLIYLVSHITLYIIYQVKQHTSNSTTDNVPFHTGVSLNRDKEEGN